MLETLKTYAKTVVKSLDAALVDVHHAYLFYGSSGSIVNEAAYLFASNIIDNTRVLSQSDSYERIVKHTHLDVLVADGKEGAISKDDMDHLLQEISLQAREKGVVNRVALIMNIENATIAAQNALLKTLEEPGKNVVFIITCQGISKVLETIVSRCNLIPFHPLPDAYYFEEACKVADKEEAYYLSHMFRVHDYAEYKNSEITTHAMQMLKDTFADDFDEFLTNYEMSYKLSDKNDNLKMIQAYLSLLSQYAHDKLLDVDTGIASYQNLLQKTTKEVCVKLLINVNTLSQRVSKYRDQTLLMAEIYRKVEEVHE